MKKTLVTFLLALALTTVSTSFAHGAQAQPAILYKNTNIGFSIEIPASWEGLYTIEESGLDEDGVIIINTDQQPDEVRAKFKLTGRTLYTLDATHISLQELGKFMPNVPMLGALLKVTGLLTQEEASNFLKDSFGKKFSSKVVESNLKALNRAFEEVKG